MARVLIIGGGIGGLEVAQILKKRGVDVTVLTRSDYYISGPSRPLLLSKEQSLDRITRGYGRTGLDVQFEHVISVDPENRLVRTQKGTYTYDYLVLATGLYYDYAAIPSEDRLYNVYDIGRLFDLRDILWRIKEGVILVSAPRQPYRCAPAPGETAMTIDMVLRHRGVRNRVDIIFVDANDKFQPPVIHDVWQALFEEAGIEAYIGVAVERIGKDHVELSDGTIVRADVKVILPPNRAINPLGDGFVPVRSPYDLRTRDYDDVFAVGDVAALPFPKNSEIASISARIAASQILEDLGLAERSKEPYRFVGWAYVGNMNDLRTLSAKFELEFTESGPKGKKDPTPSERYTEEKDRWEQAVLRKLFGY